MIVKKQLCLGNYHFGCGLFPDFVVLFLPFVASFPNIYKL
jgi:hypothetical protein